MFLHETEKVNMEQLIDAPTRGRVNETLEKILHVYQSLTLAQHRPNVFNLSALINKCKDPFFWSML